MTRTIPITLNFGSVDPDNIIGKATVRGTLTAKEVFENIDKYTFEPGYITHTDGSVELIEISAVIRKDNNDD